MGIFSLPSRSLVTAAASRPLPRAAAPARLVPALLFSLCGSRFRFFMWPVIADRFLDFVCEAL